MTSYINSFFTYLSTYFKDRISYYFYRNEDTKENNEYSSINKSKRPDLELFKFKVQEYIIENNLGLDIHKMYDELCRYNPGAANSQKISFIVNFIENELNYEEKLGQFHEETKTNKIVEKIEKITILTRLLNDFKTIKDVSKKIN